MRKHPLLGALVCLSLVTVVGVLVFWGYAVIHQGGSMVMISQDSGIYSESIEVAVVVPDTASVFYTLNGKKPGEEGTLLYEGPIRLSLEEETVVYSFQFQVRFEDETLSPIYRREYILDPKGAERFTTSYIFSLTGDQDKLFGYEEGLLVRGKLFDDYMAAHESPNIYAYIPANYWSNEEIEVHASVFLGNGQEILSQNCGFRLTGGLTRVKNQKSIRLTARRQYDQENDFMYPFWTDLVSAASNSVMEEHQRINLHNSGNDNGYAFVRNVLINDLARQSGFPDTIHAESATLYINGTYQGVYWLQNVYDDQYFENQYGPYQGEMAVSEGALFHMNTENPTENEQRSDREYNEFCQWLETADLSVEENWERVCDTLDIENFARYTALEYFVGNTDWPENNVKAYRYFPARGEVYEEGTVFDGRYRYLLFDMDYGLGLEFLDTYGNSPDSWLLWQLLETPIFHTLTQREEFRDLFLLEVGHLMGGSFSEKNVTEALNGWNNKREEELRYMMEESQVLKDSLWESDDNNMEKVRQEMEEIVIYAREHPKLVLEELNDTWDCGDLVKMDLEIPEGVRLAFSGMEVGGESVETCFEKIPLEVSGRTTPGITIKGYIVNGEFLQGDTLLLVPGEYQEKEEESVRLEVVIDTEEAESLTIDTYHIQGTEDYVILRNQGQTSLNLSSYGIGDSLDAGGEERLSDLTLAAGECFYVYGRRYSGEMEQNSMQVPFAWNTEEPVVLWDAEGKILEVKNLAVQ